jgi:hypothetical protein
VAEFVSSGMRRSEFCRSRGSSVGTLNRHLKKERWKRKSRTASAAGRLGASHLSCDTNQIWLCGSIRDPCKLMNCLSFGPEFGADFVRLCF